MPPKAGTSSTPAIATPPEVLTITWEPKEVVVGQDDLLQLIKNPRSTIQKYIPEINPPWTDNTTVTVLDFFNTVQLALKEYVDVNVQKSSSIISILVERQNAEQFVLGDVMRYLNEEILGCQRIIQQLLTEKTQVLDYPMDLDIPEAVSFHPNFLLQIQEAIDNGQLDIQAPPPPPKKNRKSKRRERANTFSPEEFPITIQATPPLQEPMTPANPRDTAVTPPRNSTPLPPSPPPPRFGEDLTAFGRGPPLPRTPPPGPQCANHPPGNSGEASGSGGVRKEDETGGDGGGDGGTAGGSGGRLAGAGEEAREMIAAVFMD